MLRQLLINFNDLINYWFLFSSFFWRHNFDYDGQRISEPFLVINLDLQLVAENMGQLHYQLDWKYIKISKLSLKWSCLNFCAYDQLSFSSKKWSISLYRIRSRCLPVLSLWRLCFRIATLMVLTEHRRQLLQERSIKCFEINLTQDIPKFEETLC